MKSIGTGLRALTTIPLGMVITSPIGTRVTTTPPPTIDVLLPFKRVSS